MTEKRWSFNGGVIVGTDICEEGIPHTNRSIVTHLNRYERKIRELEEENEQLKKELEKYSGWCNSVKRENIDKVLKMSVFEIVEAFEYYDEKIEDYERVLKGDV